MIVEPGSTIGVLGSGQLGRMLAVEAQLMGYRVHVYSQEENSPTGQVANKEVLGSYSDTKSLSSFARGVDVVTLEFEHIPLDAIETVEEFAPVHPGRHVIRCAQNRIYEKDHLTSAGLPVAGYATAQSKDEVLQFFADCDRSRDFIIKSAVLGYDGKGQVRVSGDDNVADALHCIEAQQFVIEDVVDFKLECSVIGARNASGAMQFFGPVINDHSNHILDVSVTAHDVLDAQVCSESIDLTASVLESLDIIGVVCVEMFLSNDNRLVINEIAPRPHNSGHLTIEAAECSQFGQQLRAICGLPLSSMELRSPAAMANLLGDHLMDQTTPWSSILSQHDVNVHLYGKSEPRKGRKMGHITAIGATAETASAAVRAARTALSD